MPIFMDLHIVPGVKAREAAEAHRQDILIEEEYGCKCMTYWIDEGRGHVFCLIDAPDKGAVEQMHGKSHGLVPHKIIEVRQELVESFLGRVSDPVHTALTESGLPLINDPSFRVLLYLHLEDPALMAMRLGSGKCRSLWLELKSLVNGLVSRFEGSEAEHRRNGYILSFATAARAAACAIQLREQMEAKKSEWARYRIVLTGGEPVSRDEQFFGEVIFQAECLSRLTPDDRIIVSSVVMDLLRNLPSVNSGQLKNIRQAEEEWITSVFRILEDRYADAELDQETLCRLTGMSRSQLYRKISGITGTTPNDLLKNFRLEKARNLLRKNGGLISETAFECGFTSPSYFTKCFKNTFGILPAAYAATCRAE